LVLLLGSVAGCQVKRPKVVQKLRGTLYIAVGINDEALDTELQSEVRRRMNQLQNLFRSLHPDVRLSVQVYPEATLPLELTIRNLAGLSPDLLVVNESTAQALNHAGLIRPIRLPASVTDQLDVVSVERTRLPDGRLVGVPLDLQPQLACFDRRRLPRSPATIDELVAESDRGLEVGLSLDAASIAWTLGPLGAIESVGAVMGGAPVTPLMRQRIGHWLGWLYATDQKRHITVFPTQSLLLEQLMKGELDWITCRSISLQRLRTRLGKHLGVAPLPSGPHGAASPITEERLMALGKSSSEGQRRLAEALARFAISPLRQRDLIQQGENVLPVNREVTPPVATSEEMAAMVASREQSLRSVSFKLVQKSNLLMQDEWVTLLTRFIFDDLDRQKVLDGLIEILHPRTGQ
jgi:arabinogalactan oligomer/maltooligosaccharide transport system substrate-binding protein